MLANKLGRAFRPNRHQVLFALLLLAVLAVNTVPSLRVNALYLLADGENVTAVDGTASVPSDRVIIVGAQNADCELQLRGGQKVTVTGGGNTQYATTRTNETVKALLKRLEITVGPLDMVKVDISEKETISVEVASTFTYYETAIEAAAYTTISTPTYRLAKGETEVVQSGQDGTRDVVYEVTYADGEFISRQAVAEENNTSVPQIAYVGTCVTTAQDGDTIEKVVTLSDGSGYLMMESGDALHFTGSMEVKCTAYTSGHGGVGTKTYTGTTVRRGCVAVDKSVIPLGTTMFITTQSGSYTYGMGYAEDTGVRGAKVDLYMDSYDECISFGVRRSIVYFLDEA